MMEGFSSTFGRRMQRPASYALIEVLVELVAAGWRALRDRMAAVAAARRDARTRRDLHNLHDHFLKDIGLERSEIDGLFR